MYKEGNEFVSGDGFIKKGVENTIKAIGEVARVGMCETDKEIIAIMMKE
jgi:L-cysteine desulfidase